MGHGEDNPTQFSSDRREEHRALESCAEQRACQQQSSSSDFTANTWSDGTQVFFRTNFRENAKIRTFLLELNIIIIFRPFFLIYLLSFRPTCSLELPQYSKRNMIRSFEIYHQGVQNDLTYYCILYSKRWTYMQSISRILGAS